ncbi:hypothetical protein [Chryseobacterium sp. MMS23-Vi53]|uniref:hypothetical protein n=1 Tax=Chryseobacterium sp. MMS23-Vi53 TaxID=3386644 RepID=UPI0039EAD3F9
MQSLKNLTATIFLLLTLVSCAHSIKKDSIELNNYVSHIVKPVMDKNKIPGLSIAITKNGKYSFFPIMEFFLKTVIRKY